MNNSMDAYLDSNATSTVTPEWQTARALVALPVYLRKRLPVYASLMVGSNLLLTVFAGVVAYQVHHWWAYLAAFLLVGARSQALYILQHEAMHWLLFENRRANDIVGVLISGALGTRLYDGRHVHFQHHREVGTASDPNMVWHGTHNKRPGTQVILFFVGQILGARLWPLINRSLFLIKNSFNRVGASKTQSSPKMQTVIDIAAILAMQSIIFVTISLLSSPWIYFALYLAPIISLTAFLEAVRSFSEHVLPGAGPFSEAEKNRLFSMNGPRVELFFVSQFNFHLHHLHHLYPTVPTFQLKKLHNWLKKNDPYYDSRYIVRNGYFNTLFRYTVRRPINGSGTCYPS